MPFDIKKLASTYKRNGEVNNEWHDRTYKRFKPKWYSLFCQHRAFTLDTGDPLATDPAEGENVLEHWRWTDSDERLVLMASKCLVCERKLIEGRLRKPDQSETSVGVLYLLIKENVTPLPNEIPEEELREFYLREWEFKKDLLADFNKLTIAIAVAASVFFDTYPSVFYAFIVACFIMISLYAASYIGQIQISRRFYRDAGTTLVPKYKPSFDVVSKYLQVIFGVAIIVVLVLMIRAERKIMSKQEGNGYAEKTRPYNPPAQQAPPKEPSSPQTSVPTQPQKTQD